MHVLAEISGLAGWIALGSVLVALVVGVLGPLVHWQVSKKQLALQEKLGIEQISTARINTEVQVRAAVRSTNRQNWIDGLRQDLSSYVSKVMRNCSLSHELHSANRFLEAATADGEKSLVIKALDDHNKKMIKRFDVSAECAQLLSRIELRLNPLEDDHNELLSHCKELAAITMRADFTQKDYSSETSRCVETIFASAKPILKKEWNKVRDGQ